VRTRRARGAWLGSLGAELWSRLRVVLADPDRQQRELYQDHLHDEHVDAIREYSSSPPVCELTSLQYVARYKDPAIHMAT
jgi:hypothetical protein